MTRPMGNGRGRLLGSLRFRLTAWYCLVLLGTLAALAGTLYLAARRELIRHHDRSLVHAAGAVEEIIAEHEDCAQLTPQQQASLDEIGGLILVHDMGGQGMVFYRSAASARYPLPEGLLEGDAVARREPWFDTFSTSGGLVRVYSAPYRSRVGRAGLIRIMDPLGDVQEPIETLRDLLFLMAPIALLVAFGGGLWLANRALRPVDQVTSMAREIEAHNLSLRLPAPAADDELGRLVDTLNQMIARLEESFASMRRFTSDASHELRTPLASILGAVDVALAHPRPPAEYVTALRSIADDVQGLRIIVDDLLVLARADAGGAAMRSEPVDLAQLVRESIDALEPSAQAAGVSIAVPTVEAAAVVGDEIWLRHLVANVLENAVKFSKAGAAPTQQVEITLHREADEAVVTVADRGPGIPENELPRVFERFYRGDAARTRGEGVGLGLAIADWIARAHGGSINVANRPEGGARFVIRLPLVSRGNGA